MAITPVKSYPLAKDTLDRLEALKQKLGVRYDNIVIEMAVKRMADQELGTIVNATTSLPKDLELEEDVLS